MIGLLMAALGAPRILLSNATPLSSVIDPTDATAQYELTNGGDIRLTVSNNTVSDTGDWMSPKVAALATNYEVFATLNSGTLTAGTTGSWLGLETTRTWTRNRTSVGSNTAELALEIRRKGTTTVLASCTVTLTAEVN